MEEAQTQGKVCIFLCQYIDQFLAYLKILIMSAEQEWMMVTYGEQGFEKEWQCSLWRDQV